ncbi:helix-turn-helix domain-containing protein [Streptococcus acidominimus]|uniref:XRE family transcriptional regulator n=1 Tax=Streptococcus acidominimus TaxID=1326 RepID=A0A4Y9FPM2_STRAI|nr:helix-turn-helix transcriptional regulator [Streptococcus acidominimus]MBF0818966.1 helix-turn-helix transcriptional regulator [Streptococcus acidominimus]MBF0837891.1 helix-turn-helix transcriptional regulator [Streptococcus acidominimus]MBF0846070.1 helix-turn-helix transcriptional regulator [Streptococcus danieliae]TFU30480.1 XRE family transcriptional regulator [Streptococcus acidominimus]
MNKLKELRKANKKTQQEVADFMDMTRRGYQKWENGESQIKPDKAQALADYFGVSVGYLLGYEEQIDLALRENIPTAIQEINKKYENYLSVYNAAIAGTNQELDNVIEALDPEQFSMKKIGDILIKLAGEIQKLESSSEILLQLKEAQMKFLTMKHRFEKFENYFNDLN